MLVRVRNVGRVAGDVVITAYFRFVDVRSQASSKLISQLFDFQRLRQLQPNASAELTFHVNPAALAVADVSSGDLVSAVGQYALSFQDGSGALPSNELRVDVEGSSDVVLEPFPAAV